MFTGIVKDTVSVEKITEEGEGIRIRLGSSPFFESTEIGESFSVSGACLTVEEFKEDTAVFFLAEETLDKTWFSELEEEDVLNLEPALTPQDRMGGHIVQRHVEDTAEVREIEELEKGWNFYFSKTSELDSYIVEKGFIAVEGISLTVVEDQENSFSVTVIPETWNETNFSELEEGSEVNIETDVTGRYIEKMAEQ